MLKWSPVRGPYFLNNLSDQYLTFATYLYLDGCRFNNQSEEDDGQGELKKPKRGKIPRKQGGEISIY
jgi:hypothetical protein